MTRLDRLARWLPTFLLLAPLACGPAEQVEELPTDIMEQALERVREAQPPEELELGDAPRLEAWPDAESRLRLQLANGEELVFERGPVSFEEQADEFDFLRFDEETLIVRVGPVGEWYANSTLFIKLDARSYDVQAAGVYHHSDVAGLGGWATLFGSVRVDSELGPDSGGLRCAYDLFQDEARTESVLVGTLELSTAESSASLRSDLVRYGVSFPE